VPTAAVLSAAGLTGVAAFQAALAAGAPWGRLSWGGAGGAGVLPTGLRVASAASAGGWLGAAALVLSGRRRATRRIAGLLLVGSAMNAASPSRDEARLWAPASLALAAVTAAAARQDVAQRRGGAVSMASWESRSGDSATSAALTSGPPRRRAPPTRT
jgi:hypothetical protein